jgi:hypothetical protein
LREFYEQRLQARREQASQQERLFQQIGNYRLLVVLAGAGLAFWNIWTLPAAVAVLVALVIWHEKISQRAEQCKRAAAFYERGLARLDNKWAGSGPAGERFRSAEHPYAEDLDVFGKGSLFQLLCAARTTAGELTLASWLQGPAPADVVLERQEAVQDLRDRVDLREDLALLGDNLQSETHPEALAAWGKYRKVRVFSGARVIAFLLALAAVIAFSGYMLRFWGNSPILLCILVEAAFAMRLRQRVLEILGAVGSPARDLSVLAQVLGRLEREQFSAPHLVNLKAKLEAAGVPPSKQIARLHKLIDRHDASRHQMFAPVARVLMWSTQFALAIEDWRAEYGPHIGEWIAAVGEMEALSSIAGYAAEHGDDPFPELADEEVLFDGRGIAHPLLAATAVRNDLRLDASRKLLMVSGSNMSGKSTLLRSVGLNTVLAWAGAPVRARRLRVSKLQIGASIRVQDSLQDGKSRFYAEITRLRQVVGLAESGEPLLFLLDEVLSGTNSHDRRIGAEAVVRGLVKRNAIGLVTTHDLALAHIADTLGEHAENVHFEDHIEDGRIAFDYRMRPGVVQKSNALELMRSIGLDV